ncbi:hypothetical protein APE_1357 [Aeropyrum pernix K1]|uniref:Uncharacterized protein n=1 Tax=Aeropyrum pernix (strain ATCC 700893 / DSM 11879 / JCM 9820 / NBRC 100138 / K1) TaxID=272557 RepID=Q9YC97_AERPE|nr:hypothetical protein [Aeropyrum pernix]BAA80351.1 hypothetical protein APE_1357 [Aeropyrum pernix K1]
MAPKVVCPLGESRGPVVYCKVVRRPVNPLAFPCSTPRYVNCRFYRQAQTEGFTVEKESGPPRPEPPAEAETRPPSTQAEPATARPGERAREQGPYAYSVEEAEKLLDPLFQASLVLDYTPLTFTVSGRTLAEIAHTLYSELEKDVGEGCFVAKTVDTPALFLKICRGKVVSAA